MILYMQPLVPRRLSKKRSHSLPTLTTALRDLSVSQLLHSHNAQVHSTRSSYTPLLQETIVSNNNKLKCPNLMPSIWAISYFKQWNCCLFSKNYKEINILFLVRNKTSMYHFTFCIQCPNNTIKNKITVFILSKIIRMELVNFNQQNRGLSWFQLIP